MLKKIIYYIGWFCKCVILDKKIPLNSSIILTDKCNLTCKHCVVAHLGYEDLAYKQACDDINKLYQTGSRMLVITGGEPFVWRDGIYSLEDVVKFAKDLGFFRTVICTNGTFELISSSDYLWVSLDGFEKEHDDIRGNIYTKVIENIVRSKHKRIYINFTVSKINASDFEKSAKEILKIKNVKGILFHLYTPYLGGDKSLVLDFKTKKEVIERLCELKKQHPIRISNTFSGLKALKNDNWRRPLWGSVTINRGELSSCCCRKGIYDKHVCKSCGCTPAVETWVLQQANPLAFVENLRFL